MDEQSCDYIKSPSPPIEAFWHRALEQRHHIDALEASTLYAQSTLVAKLRRQPPREPLIAAITDIDGTYISRSSDPAIDAQFHGASEKVKAELEQRSYPHLLVSGRNMRMIDEERAEDPDNLWSADILSLCVGTEIWIKQTDGSYVSDTDYQRYIEEQSKFNRPDLYQKSCALLRHFQEALPRVELKFQPRDTPDNVVSWEKNPDGPHPNIDPPQPFKISFNFTGTKVDKDTVFQTSRKFFDENGYPLLKIIICYSKQGDNGQTEWNVDLVPVSKSDAVNYMVQKYGCIGIVAGDSGNDTDMLLESAASGIVVGGAKDELTQAVNDTKPIRTTRHFRVLDRENRQQLMYIEPSNLQGPQSLQRAIHAYQLLKAFALPTTTG